MLVASDKYGRVPDVFTKNLILGSCLDVSDVVDDDDDDVTSASCRRRLDIALVESVVPLVATRTTRPRPAAEKAPRFIRRVRRAFERDGPIMLCLRVVVCIVAS